MFIAALFTTAKTWKQSKCLPAEGCLKKMWYICTTEYYCRKRNEVMPFSTTWLDLEMVTRNEVSQTRTNIIYTTYMWNLKCDTNSLIYKT